MIVRVAVGSANPCKIEAVRKAFEDVYNRIDCGGDCGEDAPSNDKVHVQIVITSHNVSSGVADQPFGDAETRAGAKNRAQSAYDAACAEAAIQNDTTNKPDFAVGLEGGLEKDMNPDTQKGELYCMAWTAILGGNGSICTAAKAPGSTYSPSDANNDTKNNQHSWGYAKTASFLLPPAISELVLEQGMELGHADDIVFDRVNSKHGSGTV
ncbi:predicted protein, partial [Thalassiosira pseudonana CCMP1335]